MEITLAIFYYIYLALVGVFIIFALFHLYYLLRFGFMAFGTVFFAIVFVIITIAILYFSYQALMTIDWSEPLQILEVNNNYF